MAGSPFVSSSPTMIRSCATLAAQLKGPFEIVVTAASATAAADFARDHRPDPALIDVLMPGGGLNATRAIDRDSPETAIVILTMDESRASVLQFLDAGAIAYLRKGIPAHQLQDRLHHAIAAHRTVAKRVARLRQAADDRFRAAFEQAGIGMAIFPLEGEQAGRIVSANVAYAEMLGREQDEVVGHNLENWTNPDDLPESFEDPIGALADGETDRVQFEQRFLHHDGHIVSHS